MWTYIQKSGELFEDGRLLGSGYSGFGEGKNNPALQNVQDVGPIPCGDWEIVGPPFNHEALGPYVLILQPKRGTETFGRSEFRMHGDSIAHPGEASHGCIIQGHFVRVKVWLSGDRDLQVIAEPPKQENSNG
jgi:hypothetical protein